MSDQWARTDTVEAPEGVVVETLSAGGIQTELKRLGNLWFLPDNSMYVYYTPMFWRIGPRGAHNDQPDEAENRTPIDRIVD